MNTLQRGKVLQSESVYQGRILDLVVDRIQINDIETIREVVRHPGGVVVLAEVGRQGIPFVRQHRYPIDGDLLELPAGRIDPGETPSQGAARELEEETGFRAHSLQHVCSFYSSPGYCDELLHFYYTNNLTQRSAHLEQDEDLVVEFYPLPEALGLVSQGEIRDGKTIAALFWLAHKRTSEADSSPISVRPG
jgi:ADP-ribose pyrophosphatase